jgi:hypothetical protein
MADSPREKTRVLTLDIKPRSREAIKPVELIQVTGHHELTLNARRAITVLWYNAHMQGVTEGQDYTIVALLLNFGPAMLANFGPPPAPQPRVAPIGSGDLAWTGEPKWNCLSSFVGSMSSGSAR